MSAELELVRAFLKYRLDTDPDSVTPAARLADLGVDSLVLLELFFEFEEKAGLQLSKDIPAPKTVGELIEIVDRLRNRARVA